MTPINEIELKELAGLQAWIRELEGAVLEAEVEKAPLWPYDYLCPFCFAAMESCLADSCGNPDCIVTKIKERRGK